MKNILRWIALLPGAVAAMIFVNAINGFTVAIIFPAFVDECCKAWFGSMAFILAAYYIAPQGKVVAAIIVATAYCAMGSFAVLIALRSGQASHPAWMEITTTALTIIASLLACLLAKEFSSHAQKESLEQVQKN